MSGVHAARHLHPPPQDREAEQRAQLAGLPATRLGDPSPAASARPASASPTVTASAEAEDRVAKGHVANAGRLASWSVAESAARDQWHNHRHERKRTHLPLACPCHHDAPRGERHGERERRRPEQPTERHRAEQSTRRQVRPTPRRLGAHSLRSPRRQGEERPRREHLDWARRDVAHGSAMPSDTKGSVSALAVHIGSTSTHGERGVALSPRARCATLHVTSVRHRRHAVPRRQHAHQPHGEEGARQAPRAIRRGPAAARRAHTRRRTPISRTATVAPRPPACPRRTARSRAPHRRAARRRAATAGPAWRAGCRRARGAPYASSTPAS